MQLRKVQFLITGNGSAVRCWAWGGGELGGLDLCRTTHTRPTLHQQARGHPRGVDKIKNSKLIISFEEVMMFS